MELRDPRSVPQLKVALGSRSRLRRKPRLWPSADVRQGFRGAVRREGVTEAAREEGGPAHSQSPSLGGRVRRVDKATGQRNKGASAGAGSRPWCLGSNLDLGHQEPRTQLSSEPTPPPQLSQTLCPCHPRPRCPTGPEMQPPRVLWDPTPASTLLGSEPPIQGQERPVRSAAWAPPATTSRV